MLTRSCLSEGSIWIQRDLEPLCRTSPLLLKDETGREWVCPVSAERRRIFGLGEYFRERGLAVNDALMLTELEPGVLQVEALHRQRQHRPPETERQVSSPAQRVVISESPYVREVRMQRPAAQPKPPSAPKPAPAAAPREARLLSPSGESPELLSRFAAAFGYRLQVLSGRLIELQALLGPQSYRVAVALPAADGAVDWAALQASQADYRAWLATRETPADKPLGLVALRLESKALERLLEEADALPLTPLELRGYWNTSAIDLDSVESMSDLVLAQLGKRATFSQLILALSAWKPGETHQVGELAPQVSAKAASRELAEMVDILSKPPFLALTRIGNDQVYLRKEIGVIMRELEHYAAKVAERLEVAAPQGRPSSEG
jgi:hypothetical protein